MGIKFEGKLRSLKDKIIWYDDILVNNLIIRLILKLYLPSSLWQ